MSLINCCTIQRVEPQHISLHAHKTLLTDSTLHSYYIGKPEIWQILLGHAKVFTHALNEELILFFKALKCFLKLYFEFEKMARYFTYLVAR